MGWIYPATVFIFLSQFNWLLKIMKIKKRRMAPSTGLLAKPDYINENKSVPNTYKDSKIIVPVCVVSTKK